MAEGGKRMDEQQLLASITGSVGQEASIIVSATPDKSLRTRIVALLAGHDPRRTSQLQHGATVGRRGYTRLATKVPGEVA